MLWNRWADDRIGFVWVKNSLFLRVSIIGMKDFHSPHGITNSMEVLQIGTIPTLTSNQLPLASVKKHYYHFLMVTIQYTNTFKRMRLFKCLMDRFDKISSPLQFMYRQLFLRLFIVSPAFIRVPLGSINHMQKNLNINDNSNLEFRAKDVLKTEFANVLFFLLFPFSLFLKTLLWSFATVYLFVQHLK